MIPPLTGENKADIGIFAAGAGAGAIVGREYVYKILPDDMVMDVYQNGKTKTYITNKFIDYAKKVAEKDLNINIDVHTDRSWVNNKRNIIGKNAANARIYTDSNERWEFQRIYNLGRAFLSDRNKIAPEDTGIAKRGAKAILYGRKKMKNKAALVCGLIAGCAFLFAKKIINKTKNNKNS